MTSTQRSHLPAWQIIMITTVICIALGLVLSWRLSIYTPETPMQVDPPPSQAEAILGVRPGLGEDTLFIQAVDGNSYEKSYKGWEGRFTTPEDFSDQACQSSEIQAIENVAGKIDHCRQVHMLGEVCPGPLVSYAVTSKGDIWQLRSTTNCGSFLAIPILIILTFSGLLFGSMIVIGSRLFLRSSQ